MLRDATLDDLPLLGPIEAAGDARFAAAGHPELADGSTIPLDVARRSIAEERLIVAEVDATVVAWAQFSRDPGEWCLGQISVLPEHQGAGIGTALLGEVIARAVTAGVRTLVLNTQDDVPWNRPWYEHVGFVVVPEAQGCCGALDLHMGMLREQAFNEASWAAIPSNSYVDAYDPNYAHYFEFDVIGSTLPNDHAPL